MPWQPGQRITADRLNNPPPTLLTSGVTAATGWQVTLQTLYIVSGVRTANVTLNRTGADITNPGGTSGNITPDLELCTVADDWRPPGSVYVSCSTGIGDGSMRVQDDGSCQWLTWIPGASVSTGSNMRWTWTFSR
ncbi:hypothetical protein QFW82_23700 [Streptomyces malaysiensis subsp. malaysiensis]|uniref:hypothetical protein n=1 Tax=Streptomyces malaysiensis TaxID=92644 RepID=UPI0024C03373|nr:hypothetical protein [Streptomyces sp. NA07423]WHX19837.1 hypothetical protein QFW82_23700 [Streptomyces sp. NA07423]